MMKERGGNKATGACLCLLWLAAWLCSACEGPKLYHAYQALPMEGWQREDTLSFRFLVPDSLVCCRLTVEIRNRNDYPYRNLALALCCEGPDAGCLSADTLCLMLADSRGTWSGDGWGGLYQSAFPAGTFRATSSGEYCVRIASAMPDGMLVGINDIGLRVEEDSDQSPVASCINAQEDE